MEHAVDVDRYCSEVDLSSAVGVMQRHNSHTCIGRTKTDE